MHRIKIKTGTGSTHSQNTAVSTTFKNSALNFPDFPNDIIATETDTTKEWTALANRSAALISQNKAAVNKFNTAPSKLKLKTPVTKTFPSSSPSSSSSPLTSSSSSSASSSSLSVPSSHTTVAPAVVGEKELSSSDMLKKDPELMSEMKVAELRALLLQENTRLIRDSIQALSKETYRALSLEKKTVQTLAERAVEQTLTSESFLKSLKPSAP